MTTPTLAWPPLIIAQNPPRLIRWRDFLLTVLMWLLFAAILNNEFGLVLGSQLEALGLGDFDTEANWPLFFERLKPFLIMTGTLVYLLVVAGVLTLRRRRIALLLPSPMPLDSTTEAQFARLDVASLSAARTASIVVVHIGSKGGVDLSISRS